MLATVVGHGRSVPIIAREPRPNQLRDARTQVIED